MKKIKGILLFGLLILLGISSSFASFNANQSIIHLRGTNPSDISIGSYFGHSYPDRFYYYAPGVVAGGSLQYFSNCPVYSSGGGLNIVYYSGGGFDINYYCGGDGSTGRLYTIPPFSASFAGTEVVGQMFINYYNLNDIYPLVFDYSYNYFTFSNDYQLTYNGVSYYNIDSTGQFGYCFYGYSDSMSCVYRLSSTDFEFHYFQNQFGNIIEEKGYILTPLYGTNKSFIFSYDSQNRLIYNIFSGVSDYISDFENFELIDKGYIDTQSLNFLYRYLIGTDHYGSFARLSMSDSGIILSSNILVYPGTSSNGVISKAFGSSSLITLQTDLSVPNILLGNGGNGNQQSTGSQPVSSLYYSCLGPTYNTPDGKPPIYCFDSSGNFNADRFRTCFSDIISSGGELQGGLFCNIDGFIQSVVFTGDGSGVSIVPCTSDSCYSSLVVGQSYINLDPVNNVTTGLVLDMITNLTGRVGRCPFPYVDFGFGATFKVFSYLKSLGYDIDPFLPLNCAVAGFHAGRYSIFEDLNLTIFDTPILNGDTKNHKILFVFFDILFIFAIFGIFRFFRNHI